jgi:hypothetical protein
MFKMLARNLDYAPSAADLPAAIQVMTEDLLRRGLTDADAYRVVEAFSKLGPHLQKWPTSRTVIEALPHAQPARTARMLIAPTPMDDYVDKYIASHPLSSKKDACLAFLREKQLLKNLPETLREEDTEAKLEREAIQSEGT